MGDAIFLGGGGQGQDEAQTLLLSQANRHGIVAGATGTGKTVTLQIMAEGFSRAGVPVFCADIKGDLSGIAKSGSRRIGRNPVLRDSRGRAGENADRACKGERPDHPTTSA